MRQQTDYYLTKKDLLEDVMRYTAILIDAGLEAGKILSSLDLYLTNYRDSVLSSLDNLNLQNNGKPEFI